MDPMYSPKMRTENRFQDSSLQPGRAHAEELTEIEEW
jgi:hypothetical protein